MLECLACKKAYFSDKGVLRCGMVNVPVPDAADLSECGFTLAPEKVSYALSEAFLQGLKLGAKNPDAQEIILPEF